MALLRPSGPALEGRGSMTYTFKLSRRMASNDWRRCIALPMLASLLVACGATSTGPTTGDDTTPPVTPGWLTIQFTTPNSDDGAVQLRVTGPALDSVVADSRYDGFGTASATVGDLVATGSIVTGNLARFRVPDVNRTSEYSVSVVAVAQKSTYALRSMSGYQAVIVR
ncbi:MAG TPA: hypothetical protein PLL69_03365 [Gemmatimonadales bacterium]|nr:hypothetical protein [Gemmatimonadales bacterium]